MLGMVIRLLRTQHGLTQKDLAKKVGMAQGYLCDIEKGRANPSLKTLEEIAAALGTDAATLLRMKYANSEAQGTTPLPRAVGK